jgi:membrane-associated phospholipid phosphatase
MEMPPLSRPYFSPDRRRESIWLWICWIVTAVCTLILVFAWPQTRSLDFVLYLYQWSSTPVGYFFKAISFLGEDEFFLIFFGIILWCVNKKLGFWTTVVLLTSAVYRGVIKDLTYLERPALAGVIHPEDTAFPSGHVLTAVAVWGYLAVRIRKTGFWAWAIFVMAGMGLSRMVLGHHFLGDVLGGFALGLPFLLFFIWLSALFVERGWVEKFSVPLLLALSVVVPVVLTGVIPGADSPKMLGYLAGACVGYILEKEKVRSVTATALPLQVVKVVIGVAGLFVIIFGLGGILPSGGPDAAFAAKMVGFFRYALGGVWGTLLAPALFVAFKLTPREQAVLHRNSITK